MTWSSALGGAIKSVGDFTGVTGLWHDITNAGSNKDPWYVDGLNFAKDIATIGSTPVRAVVKGGLALGQESYKLGGYARQAIETGILDTPLMYNKFKNPDETYDEYRQRVNANKDKISLGQAALSVFSPGKNTGDNNALYKDDWTANNLRFMSKGFDIFNTDDRQKAFNNEFTGHFITGATDLGASTIIDPLSVTGFLGKGLTIASKGAMLAEDSGKFLNPMYGKLTRLAFGKFAMTDTRMGNVLTKGLEQLKLQEATPELKVGKAAEEIKFLAQTDAKDQYKYWDKKQVTNPDAMAYLFGQAKTPEEVVDTFKAVMLKDSNAISKILATDDAERTMLFNQLSDVPKEHREMLEGNLDGDVITHPLYNDTMSKYIAKQISNPDNQAYREALSKVSTGTELQYGFGRGPGALSAVKAAQKDSLRTFGSPDVLTVQPTSLHPLLKVYDFFTKDVPSGMFQVNDANSYKDFNIWLREANDLSKGAFTESSKVYADKYLTAQSTGERFNIITQAENEALSTLFPDFTRQEIDKIYAIFDSRRQSVITRMKNQGYVSHFEGDTVQHSQIPMLQREGANVVVTADLRRLKNGIDAHAAVLPNVLSGVSVGDIAMRGDRALKALDTVNDIFKTSVLLRLGYTTRNLAEAQLSMLAKGAALPAIAASGGKAAVARFFDNRQTGFQRLSDSMNVMLGRKDSVSGVQRNIADVTDELRSVNMGRRNLATATGNRIQEVYRSIAERGLNPITGVAEGPTTQEEDALNNLHQAFADSQSQLLYHGSAEKDFTLNKNKPIALSGSYDTASGYAKTDTPVSIENYLKGGLPAGIRPASAEDKIAAAESMKADMAKAIDLGNTVLMRQGNNKTFHKVNAAYIATLNPKKLERAVFRVQKEVGSVNNVRLYGESLSLSKWSELPEDTKAIFGDANSFKQWIDNKGWRNTNDPIFQHLRETGKGSIIVPDDGRAGGVSTIALPEAVGENGRKRQIDLHIQQLRDKALSNVPDEMLSQEEQRAVTGAERRALITRVRRSQRAGLRDKPVSPYYTLDSANAAINGGLQDAVQELANREMSLHMHLDDLATRLGASLSRAESLAVKQRVGYGTFEFDVNGHTYTLPKAFENASYYMGRTSAEDSWMNQIGSQEMAFASGQGARSVRLVKPNDPRYFEAWSNILNMHFRDPESGLMDPVVEKILAGENDRQILQWMTKTDKGRYYANDTYTRVGQGYGFTALRAGELDEHLAEKIQHTRDAVKLYIPDQSTADLLLAKNENGKPVSGAAIQQHLTDNFSREPEKLPAINGLLVTTSKEYKDQERLIDTFNRRIMRFLGSLPEDTFARHPLVSGLYERNLRISIAKMSAAKGTEALTADELNKAEMASREYARREAEKTLFTIIRRSGASSSRAMKLLFPFYAAYENTLKRWGGMIAENPAIATTASRTVAQVINGQDVVDSNGNRVTDSTNINGSDNLIVRVPQGFIDSLPGAFKDVANNAFKEVRIPLSSLDVITQGQPGNPGFGPFATLPAYMILKSKPEAEQALSPFFPAGMPQNATDIFLPSVLRRLKTAYGNDALYVRTFNQMLRYETYNYNQGKRTDVPTMEEVADKTRKFFLLRALQSISLPFSVAPELDFYAQQYRQFQNLYPPRQDPTTKKMVYGEADAKFLEQYPDFFTATISLSKNPGGLESSLGTVQNLKRFSGLMSIAQAQGDPELMGWIANDGDNKYTFSQAAYQWLQSHGSIPGAANTYLQNRNPAELVRDANIKQGWTEYQSLMGQIDTYKIANNIVSSRDPLLKTMNNAKKVWLEQMKTNNQDWYAAYISPDRGKYMRRANVLEQVTKDPNWLKAQIMPGTKELRPVVKNVILYLDYRNQIGSILQQRKLAGGSADINANQNADISYVLDKVRTQLSAENVEFGDFLNRYFPNDPVTV